MPRQQQYGRRLEALSTLDETLTVPASSAVNGTTKYLEKNQFPASVALQFGISQSGTTDQADVDVSIQWSEDGINWPDDDQTAPVFSWVAANAGDDLTRSKIQPIVPLARYFRLIYTNNNGTDSFTVNSSTANHFERSQGSR